jgi:hypothetical protein
MMPRRSMTRKYRPRLEALETRQLLSAGPPTRGPMAVVPATAPASPHAGLVRFHPCGTGKGIIIITSG